MYRVEYLAASDHRTCPPAPHGILRGPGKECEVDPPLSGACGNMSRLIPVRTTIGIINYFILSKPYTVLARDARLFQERLVYNCWKYQNYPPPNPGGRQTVSINKTPMLVCNHPDQNPNLQTQTRNPIERKSTMQTTPTSILYPNVISALPNHDISPVLHPPDRGCPRRGISATQEGPSVSQYRHFLAGNPLGIGRHGTPRLRLG